MAIVLEVRSAQGDVSQQRLQPGRNRITVRPGDAYRIIDDQTQHTPPGVVVKRVENSVLIDGLGSAPGADAATVVELTDYYGICSAGSPCDIVVDEAGQQPVVISPISNSIGALADGSYVLYDRAWVAPPEAVPADDSGGLSRPMLYGIGGVAIAGLALGGGGGGGGGSAVDPGPSGDGTLKVTSPASTNSRTPLISGTGTAGRTVSIQLYIDSDNLPDARYDAVVAADGTWQVNLATATPISGGLPASGLPDATRVLVSSGTNEVLPTYTLIFDNVPPAPARVDPITVDGVISGAEKAAGIQVTGAAEAGGSVLVTWGSIQKVGAVDASGRWSVSFASAEIPPNGQSELSVVARDAAGNAAPATLAPVLVSTEGPVLSITQIGAGQDTVINAAEAAAGVTVRGSADPNATIAVSWSGATLTAVANASGDWAVTFQAAQVPNPTGADGQTFPMSVTATSTVGNSATRDIAVRVDRAGPGAPSISAIETDDRVTLAERADGVRVSGSAEASAQVSVAWGGSTVQTQANASGQWSVNFTAEQVPTANGGAATVPVTARATDAAGNPGELASRGVVIEPPYTAPTIAVVAGDDRVSAAERAGNIVLSGTVQAGAPGVAVTWGSFTATVQPTGATWQVTVPAAQVPADGQVPVTAAIAVAGGPSVSRPVTIDTTPPGLPVIDAVAGDNRVSPTEGTSPIAITGSAEANARVEVSWQGASQAVNADAAGRWTASLAAPQVAAGGAATVVSVVAIDGVGNRGTAATASVFVEAPFAAPTVNPVAGDSIINQAEASTPVAISGSHAPGVTALTLTIDTVTVPVTLGAGNTWQASVTPAQWQAIGEGPATLTITNGGTGGGAATAQQLTVDRTAPGPTVALISGNDVVVVTETNVVVSGQAPGANQVSVQIDAGAAQPAAVGADGSWTTTFATMGTQGSHQVTVRATDLAGNEGVAVRPYLVNPFDLLGSGAAAPALSLEMMSVPDAAAISALATSLPVPVTSASSLIDELGLAHSPTGTA